jgi:hypothetical protein
MKYNRLYDGGKEHERRDGEAFNWTRGQLVGHATQSRTLIRGDKREEETQELWLKERKAVLKDFETTRRGERSPVRDEQSRP